MELCTCVLKKLPDAAICAGIGCSHPGCNSETITNTFTAKQQVVRFLEHARKRELFLFRRLPDSSVYRGSTAPWLRWCESWSQASTASEAELEDLCGPGSLHSCVGMTKAKFLTFHSGAVEVVLDLLKPNMDVLIMGSP